MLLVFILQKPYLFDYLNKMEPINDVNCGWLHGVDYRSQFEQIKGLHTADFVIIGAGITGLSAARQLGKLMPNNKIIEPKINRAIPLEAEIK